MAAPRLSSVEEGAEPRGRQGGANSQAYHQAIEDLDEYTLLQKYISTYRTPSRSTDRRRSSVDPYTALWGLGDQRKSTVRGKASPNDTDNSPPKDRVFLIQPDIFKAGRDSALYLLQKTVGELRVPTKVVLNLASLQRIALQDLQQRIVVQVAALKNHPAVYVKKEESCMLVDLLHKYTNGVRDLDYMQECAKRDFDHDPFLMMTSRELDWQVMKRAGLLSDNLDQLLPVSADHEHPIVFASTPYRHYANQTTAKGQILVRLSMALFGGLGLVVPMLVMVLVPGRTVSLIVTSVFTLAFAVVLALRNDLEPDKILAATAAYAAVLVVFVGASQNALGN